MTALRRALRSHDGAAECRGFRSSLTLFSLLACVALFAAPAFAVGTLLDRGTDTGEKPQSKIFHHDGSWWAVVEGDDGVAFYEQSGSSWGRAQFLDAVVTSGGNSDVKWNGTHLFVLVYSSSPKLYKYTYDPSLRAFNLVSGFPVTVPRPSGSETMVLEQDSTGRLWTTAEGDNNINVYYSSPSDHTSWSGPVVLQSGVSSDDISTIVAFGSDKVGVFWSDQNRDEFGFRVHHDGDAPGSWDSKEIADSGSGHADDHINAAFDSQGRLFFVTKDDRDEMAVHRRNVSGSWTTEADILGVDGTRGIIMLDEESNRLYVLYTRWGVSTYPIEMLESSMENMDFGNRTTWLSASSDMNNVTGTKQILPEGTMVAIAHASASMFWNAQGTLPASSGPSAPEALVATLTGAPARVDLSWDPPSSGTPIGYNVYRQIGGGSFLKLNGSLVGTESFTDFSPAEDALCYRVTAVDGSESAPSAPDCVDNTQVSPPGQPLNLTSEALAGNASGALSLPFDEGQGQTAGDLSGNGNDARLGDMNISDSADPTWIAGVSGGALRFDGIDDHLQVPHATSLDMDGSFTIETWLRQDEAVTGTLVNKGGSGERTYRVLISFAGAIEFRWEDTNSGQHELITPPALNLGTWHHIACVYDAVTNENRVYVDGSLQATGSASGSPFANGDALTIGTRLSSASGSLIDFFAGAFDDLRISPGALYDDAFVPQQGAGDGTPTLVRLQWQEPVSGGAAVAYDVLRSTDNGPWQQANGGPVTTTSWIDGNLPPGDHCYQVVALNAQNESGPPSNTTCETLEPSGPPPPGAPTDVAVVLAGTVPEHALLSWNAPTTGTPATGYHVYRAIDNEPYALLNATPVTTTGFTDSLLSSGEHCYQVLAVDADERQGVLSTAACISYLPPPPPLPAAPTGLAAVVSTQPGTISEGNGAWPLDENQGQSAADATGNGNTGRLGTTPTADASDPVWGAGQNGSALVFDGTNDFVEIPDAPTLRFPGSFTIEAWVKRASGGSGQVIVAKGDSDQRNFWLRIGSTGIVDFRWETSSGGNHGTDTNATLGIGTWHHVACVYDMQAAESRIYIDGVLVETENDSGTPVTSADPVHIGVRLSDGSRKEYFHGSIDMVRLSAGALYTSDFTPPASYASEEMTVAELDWQDSASSGVVGYNVYRNVAGGTFHKLTTDPVPQTSWTDDSTLNETLCYQVCAVDFVGQESPPSDPDCVTITGPPPAAPSPPLALAASNLGTTPESVQLQWQEPAQGQAVGYHVERRLGTDAWERLTTTAIPSLAYTDDDAPLGDLCYRVVARDAFSQESAPSQEACTTVTPPPAPAAPDTLLAAFLGTDPESVALSWPASSGGLAAVGYNVYRSVHGAPWTLQQDSLTTLSWTDSLLLAGTLCYQVAAFDSLGREGAVTTAACLTWEPPLGPPPSAPRNLIATLMDDGAAKAAMTPEASTASDSLIRGAWGFDEASGDVVVDARGQIPDGHLGNGPGADSGDPLRVPGWDGMALEFSGAQSVTIPDTAELRLDGSFTIEAWVYRTSNDGAQVVLSKGDSDQRNFWLRLRSHGDVDFRWESAGGRNHGAVSSGSVPLEAWHHIACVYDMEAGENRIYIDGVLDEVEAEDDIPITSDDPLLIGTRLSGGSPKEYFEGRIDLVRISAGVRYEDSFTPKGSLETTAAQVVRLDWEVPQDGIPAGYRIYRSVDAAPQVLVNDELVTTLTWDDTQPVVGVLSYKVSAVDAWGQEGPQSPDSVAVSVDDGTPPPPPAPSAPQQLVAALEELSGGSSGDATYLLDENAGQQVLDASGNAIHGVRGATAAAESTDPTWVAGVGGAALQFDGVDDRVTIPDAPGVRQTGSFTLEAWVRWNGGAGVVLAKGDSDQRNYWVRVGSTGIIDFRWEVAGGGNRGDKSNARLTQGQWHHVACVYDMQAGLSLIFLDGVLVEDENDSGTPATSADPLHLGVRLSDGSLKEWFNGSIDLVRISSGALYTEDFTPPTSYGSGTTTTVASLSWTAPENGTVDGYHVYRSMNAGTWVRLNTSLLAAAAFTDPAPGAGENCYRVTAVDDLDQEGAASTPACVTRVVSKVVAVQELSDVWSGPRFRVHPNPFNPQTRISFRLPDARHLTLQLFDVRGRRVATLARGMHAAGMHAVRWDGRGSNGILAGTGTYFVVLQAGDIRETQKLILVK